MASTENLWPLFLLMVMAQVTSVSAEDSEEYIFGKEEDKLLLPFVILLIVFAVLLLIVAIVVPCLVMKKYSRKSEEIYHMEPPARTSLSRYSSSYYGETNKGNLEEGTVNAGYETLKINGVEYDNPTVTNEDDNANDYEEIPADSARGADKPNNGSVNGLGRRPTTKGDTAL